MVTIFFGGKMDEQIGSYPVVIEFPVAWGEMDAFQHVNNTVYFKYFENARIAYFVRIKLLEAMQKTGIGPIMASTQCHYKVPLTYPDVVTVGAKVADMEKNRFVMNYIVISQKFEKTAALGEGVLVAFDYQENKKVFIPDEIRRRIVDLEESVG
jgi:acyl-CoA thioester hydrolase